MFGGGCCVVAGGVTKVNHLKGNVFCMKWHHKMKTDDAFSIYLSLSSLCIIYWLCAIRINTNKWMKRKQTAVRKKRTSLLSSTFLHLVLTKLDRFQLILFWLFSGVLVIAVIVWPNVYTKNPNHHFLEPTLVLMRHQHIQQSILECARNRDAH